MPAPSPKSRFPLYVVLTVAVIVCFGNVARHEFTLWDDVFNISLNPHLNPPTFASIWWYWKNPAYSLYIPVTYTVWGLLASAAYLPEPDNFGVQLNPYVFHIANIVAHLIAAIAAFKILERLVPNLWAACVGALVFALHPLQVESVGWAAGLKDVLCGMFTLLAIWQYLAADEQRSRARYVLAALLLVLAMLSKPTAMVAPAIVLAIDIWMLRRPWKRALILLAPWLVLSVACAVIAKLAQPAIGIERAPLWARPLIAGDSLAFYLYKLALPIHLGIDYGRRPGTVMQSAWIYFAWVVPAALMAWTWSNRVRRPHLWVGLLVFVIGLAPVLGFSTFLFQYYSTTADHYVYISMLGPGIVVAGVLARHWTRAAILIAVCAIALLGFRSILQTQTWHDDELLNRNAIAVFSDSFLARNNLGHYYAQTGEHDRALPLFLEAVKLRPDNWQVHENLGLILADRGEIDAAVHHIEKAIRFKQQLPLHGVPNFTDDFNRLGMVLMSRGRYTDAAKHFEEAIRLDPKSQEAKDNLAAARARIAAAATSPATSP